ncbi:hypothetical protein JX265_004896 [Neoarthrinium moseri]|uniref:Uncharacterized protein n=1 Tax=Neoarthrinium moseri TaxID=1658444 RepID=A0A9P9WQI8_9PEZI|nr:hypothetical protein JX265_004896 [Neoarthrinium moseri]
MRHHNKLEPRAKKAHKELDDDGRSAFPIEMPSEDSGDSNVQFVEFRDYRTEKLLQAPSWVKEAEALFLADHRKDRYSAVVAKELAGNFADKMASKQKIENLERKNRPLGTVIKNKKEEVTRLKNEKLALQAQVDAIPAEYVRLEARREQVNHAADAARHEATKVEEAARDTLKHENMRLSEDLARIKRERDDYEEWIKGAPLPKRVKTEDES